MNFQHQIGLLQKMVFGPTSQRFKMTEAAANRLSLGVTTGLLPKPKLRRLLLRSTIVPRLSWKRNSTDLYVAFGNADKDADGNDAKVIPAHHVALDNFRIVDK